MNTKIIRKVLIVLLVVVSVLSLIGMGVLVTQAQSASLAIFELLAFSISVIAVFLALLGAMTSMNQTKAMERISRNIREAINGLKDLDAESALIRKKLSQDYALAKDIAEALTEAGIMIDDSEKQKNLAGKIEKRIRKK